MKLTSASISSITEGASVPTLLELKATKRNIDEIVGLGNCPKLQKLDLSDNDLTNLKGIEGNLQLKWLSVKGNQIKSLEPLKDHEKLTVLNVSQNQVCSLRGVEGSGSCLKALIASENCLKGSDLGALRGLAGLNTLVLSHNNDIQDLGKALRDITQLNKLSVSHCSLRSLDGCLRWQNNLTELRVAHNQLGQLPLDLRHNTGLRILDAGHNPFKDWQAVEVLGSLPLLVNLNLHGSPLAEAEDYQAHITQLCPHLQVLDGHKISGHETGRGKRRRVPREGGEENEQGGGPSHLPQAKHHKKEGHNRRDKKEMKLPNRRESGQESNSEHKANDTDVLESQPFLEQVWKEAAGLKETQKTPEEPKLTPTGTGAASASGVSSSGVVQVLDCKQPRKSQKGKKAVVKGAAVAALLQQPDPFEMGSGVFAWDSPVGLLSQPPVMGTTIEDKAKERKLGKFKSKQTKRKNESARPTQTNKLKNGDVVAAESAKTVVTTTSTEQSVGIEIKVDSQGKGPSAPQPKPPKVSKRWQLKGA